MKIVSVGRTHPEVVSEAERKERFEGLKEDTSAFWRWLDAELDGRVLTETQRRRYVLLLDKIKAGEVASNQVKPGGTQTMTGVFLYLKTRPAVESKGRGRAGKGAKKRSGSSESRRAV